MPISATEKMKVVSTKVPPAQRARLEQLASSFPNADGTRGNLSAVLRTWLDLGEVLYEPGRVRKVRALAEAAGGAVAETWAKLVDAGLAALSSTPTPDPEAGGIDLDITEAQVARVEALARERGWTTPDTFRRLLAAGFAALTAEPAKGKRAAK